MAVLATPDWLYNTRDNTMDIPSKQQRTSPAIEANNNQQQQQQPGQHHYQQQHYQQQQQQLLHQQQQMLLAAQQQQPPFTYPVQQQPHGSWTPNITAAPFYPSFFQQQQQPQPYPGPQGTYYDPTNAQFAAQWAYQQMMLNAQHVFPQSQRQNQPASPNVFNPFPSGTPPPPPHRQISPDQYPGFHPYRRPNRQQSSADSSSDRRQGPIHPPYARPDASASSSSISSSGSRQRTNSNQSIKSNNNNSSNSRRGSPVSATVGGPNATRNSPSAGGGPGSPIASQPANPSPLRQPHHRTSSTSSTSTATSIRPGASLSPSLPTSSVSTTSATATTTATITTASTSSAAPRLTRPSPLSQGTFTVSEKRISRDDIDLGALQDASQRESSRSGGLKGRLRRALSFNAAEVLREEDVVLEQDDDASIKASQINNKIKGKATATSSVSASSFNPDSDKPVSPNTNPPHNVIDDGSSTRTPQPKKKSRAASLFNSRMNMSTDNISLSSTVSSASVMIRKLGAMGRLARRNSLAGIASLFKDKEKEKDGESKDKKGKKKDKKHSAKAEASEASVSHVTAELDRMGGDWTVNSAELQGLTPAAKLARQHTLKSNAEAAAKAKEAAAAAAARDAEAAVATAAGASSVTENGVAGVATWDRNTATRQGSPIKASLATNIRINEDGTRTLIEDDDDDSDDERHYGHQPFPSSSSYAGTHPHSDGWDDDEDWELDGDEDVTIRGADVSSAGSRSGSLDEDGVDHSYGGPRGGYGRPSAEMEPWGVDIRRSIERTKKPAKGILRNAQSYDQNRYLQHNSANVISRGRSNSYTSTNTNAEIGPLARMPSPDPDHIDGLRHNPRSSPLTDVAPFSLPPLSFDSSSSLNVSFGLSAKSSSSGKDLPHAPPISSSHSENHGQNRTSAIFQNPIFNSSAPTLSLSLLSGSTKHPPTLAHRSQTAPIKRLTFASNLSVYDTFPSAVYDRRSEPATWNRLTPTLAQRIKEELNSYKMEEMEVHAASRIHTQFFV